MVNTKQTALDKIDELNLLELGRAARKTVRGMMSFEELQEKSAALTFKHGTVIDAIKNLDNAPDVQQWVIDRVMMLGIS